MCHRKQPFCSVPCLTSSVAGFRADGFKLAQKTAKQIAIQNEMEPNMMMAASWHGEADATPTPNDVKFMAEALEGCHGVWAIEIANFFSSYHGGKGDAGRAWAWGGVAELLRTRERDRQNEF